MATDRPSGEIPDLPELPSFRIEENEGEVVPLRAVNGRSHAGASREGSRESRAALSNEEIIRTRHAGTGLKRYDAELSEKLIDQDAARTVRRLEAAGFEAYLVGGCVRDLLLGDKPKDFDIATSARPEDVRRLFRNCRIIGRRFRLAHVFFGRDKILEVATFRRNPTDADEESNADILIRNDNAFGDAHEDAIRRDFTINGLFYDLDRKQVLDWVGGMPDIERRTIAMIGVPSVRFREDPVRILRAIKFAARRDLGIHPDVYDAMVAHADELKRASKPRLFEELLRLLRQGGSQRSFWLLWEIGALAMFLPEISAYVEEYAGRPEGSRFWKLLGALDQINKERGQTMDDASLVAILLREPLQEVLLADDDPSAGAFEFLEPLVQRMGLTRRIADAVRRIVLMQVRFERGKGTKLLRSEWAREAVDAYEVWLLANGRDRQAAHDLRAQIPKPTRAPRGPSR
ncbi:MAG: polynucleotide adenylyltransferase PcnB [Polyangiaceae bacterium]|nr:polynucleotide adenylyltransferase PcnB [Polyangiaceae bacterium]